MGWVLTRDIMVLQTLSTVTLQTSKLHGYCATPLRLLENLHLLYKMLSTLPVFIRAHPSIKKYSMQSSSMFSELFTGPPLLERNFCTNSIPPPHMKVDEAHPLHLIQNTLVLQDNTCVVL